MAVAEHTSPPGAGSVPGSERPRFAIVPRAGLPMVAVVVYLASYLPRRAPLGLPVGLIAAAALLLLANVVLLSRLKEFAWFRFFQVARWGLLAFTGARFERGRVEAGDVDAVDAAA